MADIKDFGFNYNWSWKDFCGRDEFQVWDKEHADFDMCFLFTTFHLPLYFLIAVFSSYYLGNLHSHINRTKKEKWIIRLRFTMTLLLSALPIVRGYLEETIFPGQILPVHFLSAVFECVAWFMHFCFLVSLSSKAGPTIRGPVLLGVIWTLNFIITWLNVHSNYLIYLKPDTELEKSGIPYYFSIVRLVFQCVYLMTLIPPGRASRSEHFESLSGGENSPLVGNFSRFREESIEVGYLGRGTEGSGFISRLFFGWVNPLIKKGVAGNLQNADDLFDLPFNITSSHLYNKLSFALNPIHRDVRTPQISLFKALHVCFWKQFYGVGILRFIADMSGFSGPLLLNLLIKFIEDKNEPIRYGYAYAFGLSISALIGAFCNCHYNFLISRIGLKIKGSLVSVIYRKTLSINSVTLSHFSVGEITNFMSSDMERIVNSCASFHAFWSVWIQLIVTLKLLYDQVGLSFLSGLAFSVILIYVNRILAVQIGKLSEKTMAHKDKRLQCVAEILRGIKAIKFLVWESFFISKIQKVRQDEMKYLSIRKYLDALCVYFWATTPVVISLLTFTTYSLSGNELTASVVFTTIALLNMLISPLNAFPWVLNGLTEAWVSLKRVEKFIELPDNLLNEYYDRAPEYDALSIENGNFHWGEQKFSLKGINLNIQRGQLIGIIGSVGSGKSSLIAAILSELEKSSGSVSVLDYSEGFGYVEQTPWLQKGTIQSNILFGRPLVQHQYSDILRACGLTNDLDRLPGRDSAYVGESGCTLSGGQKARIALARAVYQDKSVYLLDDILSAVDPHIARHIFSQCICGILRNKTRLLFTNQQRFLINADHIVILKDGKIHQQGPPVDVLPNFKEYSTDLELGSERFEPAEVEKEELVATEVTADDEERARGSLDWSIFVEYVKSAGICLWPLILASVLLMQGSRNGADYWLSVWVSNSNNTFPSILPFSNSTSKYLYIYAGIAGLNSIFTLLRAFLFAFGGLQAARKLQKKLLEKVLDAKMLFFETNSTGRILNRFSSDVYTIDDSLPFILNILIANFFGVLGTILVALYGLPWLILLLSLLPVYHNLQSSYRLTSRELKRLESTTMSPLQGHFKESLAGAKTIRAFRSNTRFFRDNADWLDTNLKAQFSSLAASQWLALRLQLIGVAMITGVGFFATFQHHIDFAEPGLIGLVVAYTLTLTNSIGGLVSSFTETERELIAVERVSQYLNNSYDGLSGEDKSSSSISIPFAWPTLGVISFHNVSYKYQHSLPYSLKSVSFVTRPNEKIGVVGRTGSGKSSLISALFRLSDIIEGEIAIDSLNIKLISLKELRMCMSIIPQDAFIFGDTIRDNLDPDGKHSDDELISALTNTYMLSSVLEIGGLYKVINKDSFSAGQSQLICLARAILRRSKIICIDEATANVDYETDRLIQQTIRSCFIYSTVITIAHRVSTIMDCDRVLVMGDGSILEFDTPSNLMSHPNSHFSQLANEL